MSKPPIGNRNLIRAINRSAVLNAVKTNGRISRTDIARDTGLSPATISAITATLIADDLVQEQAEATREAAAVRSCSHSTRRAGSSSASSWPKPTLSER
ncbi:MAG TPA: winged helix-turn-helix domain-containing protein [Anaerolineales bacterium]